MPRMFRYPISVLSAGLAVALGSADACAQSGTGLGGDGFVRIVTTRFDPAPAKAGQEVDLVVAVEVAADWHVYGSADLHSPPITFTTKAHDDIVALGEPLTPPGDKHDSYGIESYWLTGAFEIRQRFQVAANAKEGKLTVEGTSQFLACDATSCLPPGEIAFSAVLEVVSSDVETGTVANAPATPPPAAALPWLKLLLLSIGAGLFALAMPCTYPMIPITFSFFTKQAHAQQGKLLPLALTYGAGIVSIFIVIGLVFSASIVDFAQHWLTNLVIGVAFLVFAFALFGMITIQPPRALMNFASKASSKRGYFGVFLMGLCLVVTSFTCTAPFVGTLLSLSAEGGHGQVIAGMGMFGLTMALPFVVLALIPGRVRAMPHAGEWMNTLKVTLGFIELAAALKFFSNVDLYLHGDVIHAWISRERFLAAWAIIFAAAALYLLGALTRFSAVSGKRRLAAVLFAAFSGYMTYGATGRPVDEIMTAIAPPGGFGDHEIIADDLDAGFARAIAADKLLLLNFTGLT